MEAIIMAENKIFSMGDCFSIEYVRNEIIKELKERGYSKEKTDELIKICDIAYNDYKIPYPTIDELLNGAKQDYKINDFLKMITPMSMILK